MDVSEEWEEGRRGGEASAHGVYRLHGGFFDIERTAEQMQGWTPDAGRLCRASGEEEDRAAFALGKEAGRAVVRTCSSLECLWKSMWWGRRGEDEKTPPLSPLVSEGDHPPPSSSLLRRPSSRNLIDLA